MLVNTVAKEHPCFEGGVITINTREGFEFLSDSRWTDTYPIPISIQTEWTVQYVDADVIKQGAIINGNLSNIGVVSGPVDSYPHVNVVVIFESAHPNKCSGTLIWHREVVIVEANVGNIFQFPRDDRYVLLYNIMVELTACCTTVQSHSWEDEKKNFHSQNPLFG